MKALTVITTLCITLLLLQCGSVNFDKTTPFKIHSSTYYNSVTSLQNNANSNIYIRYTSKDNINFDSLYFRKNKIKVETKYIRGEKYVFGEFQKKKLVRDITLDANPIKELNNTIHKIDKYPFDLEDDEAVLTYQLKGKTKYFKIKDIHKRDSDTLFIKQ